MSRPIRPFRRGIVPLPMALQNWDFTQLRDLLEHVVCDLRPALREKSISNYMHISPEEEWQWF
jgi:hypothetical protein